MNSRVTMGLATVLLLGAIVVGYWGLVLSRQPAPVAEAPAPAVVTVEKTVAAAEDQTRQPVVVLVRDVPPFTPSLPPIWPLKNCSAPPPAVSVLSNRPWAAHRGDT